MKALKRNSASPPSFKKTCPCTILAPSFFNFSDPFPFGGSNQNLLPQPLKRGFQTMGSGLATQRTQLVFNLTSICLQNNMLFSDISMYDPTLILGRLDNFEVIHFLGAQLYWNFRRGAASFRGELYLLGGSGTFRRISYNIYN